MPVLTRLLDRARLAYLAALQELCLQEAECLLAEQLAAELREATRALQPAT